jgi:multiple antibiotic resistance protein
MNWRAFSETFVTLLVIMDPVGAAPIFIALTEGRSPRSRTLAALQAAATAGALVALFALFGRLLLDYLGVSIESLTIAGGLLLVLVALQMFRGEQLQLGAGANVALVPLAMPLLAGPGAIAAIMVLSSRYPDAPGRVGVIVAVPAVVAVVAVGLMLAGQIARLLRPAAVSLLERVLALLLSAIAVQLVLDAVRQILRTPA